MSLADFLRGFSRDRAQVPAHPRDAARQIRTIFALTSAVASDVAEAVDCAERAVLAVEAGIPWLAYDLATEATRLDRRWVPLLTLLWSFQRRYGRDLPGDLRPPLDAMSYHPRVRDQCSFLQCPQCLEGCVPTWRGDAICPKCGRRLG